MRRIRRSVLLAFPATAVLELVTDVDRYVEFLPWCTCSEVLTRTPTEVIARIGVIVRGQRQTLVTRNRLVSAHTLTLELMEGPFQNFSGYWDFKPLGAAGCRVDLSLSFELANALVDVFAGPILDRIADTLVDAFADRARRVLGE